VTQLIAALLAFLLGGDDVHDKEDVWWGENHHIMWSIYSIQLDLYCWLHHFWRVWKNTNNNEKYS